jgi:hypothetical protein
MKRRWIMQCLRSTILGGALVVAACSSFTEPRLPAWDPVLRSTFVAENITDYGAVPPNLLLGTDPEDDCANAAILSFDLDPRIYRRTVDGGLRLGAREASCDTMLITTALRSES